MSDFYQKQVHLETEHLVLRELRETDREDIFNNINHDKEVLKYYLDNYHEDIASFSLEKTLDWCRKAERYYLAIVLKDTGEVIGTINQCSGINRYFNNIEIGYALGSKYWNKGYGTEALKAFITFLFGKGIHKVYCGCIKENTASSKVMLKAGMKYEGTRIQEIYYHERYWDIDYYCLING